LTDVLLDSHFHLLQPDMEYPWITDDLARSLRSHSQSELEDEFAQNNVAGGVVVQALNDVRETKTLLKLAPSNPYILGVVGWLDLTSSSIDEDLARVMEGPGGERLVGIRHQIVDAADPAGPLLPHVMRGLEHVAAAGLTFDLVIHQRDIPIAREVAAALPHLALIVDHLAKPDPHPENMTAWREDLASLAAFPNTTCKLSGLVTEALPLGEWTHNQLEPFLHTALQLFGADRCMYGSDWPVCRLAATYAQVVELAMSALSSLSMMERSRVLHRNAIDVYNLNLPSMSVLFNEVPERRP
jgi:L-fuconolactonase